MERQKSSKSFIIRHLVRIIVWGSVAFILMITLYAWYLSAVIDKRFSARRWSIPSRVYSDSTILYPGQSLNPKSFREKLGRLGYRGFPHAPMKKGDMYENGSALELYLYDLSMPSKQRKGFPLRFNFQGNRIASIVHRDTGEQLPLVELEPEEIMFFFGRDREQRRLVSINEVPLHLKCAVLTAEDSRFYRHHGIDPRGILRALYTNIRHGAIRQGGSTLTQQLAKNYFLTPERTVRRKVKEFLMALTMEVMYDKDVIFEIYLNEIYLGQKGSIAVHGIDEASHFYFGKEVQKLTVAESAAIAGLIKGPNHYSPYIDPERCRNWRDSISQDMYRNGWITKEELEEVLEASVNPVGYSAYRNKAPYFIDYLSGQLPVFYSAEDLASRGLSIYTTLDTQVQMAAERALKRGLARLERSNPTLGNSPPDKQLQGAIIVMHPKTGYILAMVGGARLQCQPIQQVYPGATSARQRLQTVCLSDRFGRIYPVVSFIERTEIL